MFVLRLGLAGMLAVLIMHGATLHAQDDKASPTPSAATATNEAAPGATSTADQALRDAQQKVEALKNELDKSRQAQQISAGLLDPIYRLAEQLAFPMFHWLAFAIMATGVISYALQLVIGKLVVLSKMGFSMAEILSDALGLVISLIGLVLTTQAAAENSTFTQSPAAVLSAAVVGIVFGFIFYRWGQSHEIQATLGRQVSQARGTKSV